MKNKLPLVIGVVVVIVAAFFFMQGGDKTAKKGGDSAHPIIIATHNWSRDRKSTRLNSSH